MATLKILYKVTSQWRHIDVAAGLAQLPNALLHNLGGKINHLQYYYGRVYMAFYQK